MNTKKISTPMLVARNLSKIAQHTQDYAILSINKEELAKFASKKDDVAENQDLVLLVQEEIAKIISGGGIGVTLLFSWGTSTECEFHFRRIPKLLPCICKHSILEWAENNPLTVTVQTEVTKSASFPDIESVMLATPWYELLALSNEVKTEIYCNYIQVIQPYLEFKPKAAALLDDTKHYEKLLSDWQKLFPRTAQYAALCIKYADNLSNYIQTGESSMYLNETATGVGVAELVSMFKERIPFKVEVDSVMSRVVQEIGIEHGAMWADDVAEVKHLNRKYLYFSGSEFSCITQDDSKAFFLNNKRKHVTLSKSLINEWVKNPAIGVSTLNALEEFNLNVQIHELPKIALAHCGGLVLNYKFEDGTRLHRPVRWSHWKRQEYIKSVLRQAYFPRLLVCRHGDSLLVIDGVQRIKTLKAFMLNELAIVYNNSSYYFNQLDAASKTFFEELTLSAMLVQISNESDIARYYLYSHFAKSAQDQQHLVHIKTFI